MFGVLSVSEQSPSSTCACACACVCYCLSSLWIRTRTHPVCLLLQRPGGTQEENGLESGSVLHIWTEARACDRRQRVARTGSRVRVLTGCIHLIQLCAYRTHFVPTELPVQPKVLVKLLPPERRSKRVLGAAEPQTAEP